MHSSESSRLSYIDMCFVLIQYSVLRVEVLSNSFPGVSQKGVRIFCRRRPHIEAHEVEALLEEYPRATLLYLEFLIHDLNSEVGSDSRRRGSLLI